MAKKIKTNSMRILDKLNIEYKLSSYDVNDGKIDGISVAKKISRDNNQVFKTLVTEGKDKHYYVFLIPVHKELDLKKCARITGEKKIEMIAVKDIQKITGYIRGGCSPIGMKKNFDTYIDMEADKHEEIVFSAGKIGTQLIVKVLDLCNQLNYKLEDLVK
ncbi:MAG: Cys-tRNA(Pro) deacylase [Firmicutes bacterium]|jgi:Cys-tRNA(Pro)/Cys-tRNA(Cys) deacylase|nr:Cys-tRNA(Pro) deacylase [Bacillota bacterium]